jgi:hypothetical protein
VVLGGNGRCRVLRSRSRGRSRGSGAELLAGAPAWSRVGLSARVVLAAVFLCDLRIRRGVSVRVVHLACLGAAVISGNRSGALLHGCRAQFCLEGLLQRSCGSVCSA